MPNGAPGDHPLTDILSYGLPVFTPEIDGLVREIDSLGGFESELASLWLLHMSGHVSLYRHEDRDDDAASLLNNMKFMLRGERDRLLRERPEGPPSRTVSRPV